MFEKTDINLEKFDDVFQAFRSSEYRKYLANVSMDYLSYARDWTTFSSLSFIADVSEEFAIGLLKGLIQALNKRVFGNNYHRIVGHSYFSYVVGMERQERGVVHFHVLIDRPVDWELIWNFWYVRAGYVKTLKCGNEEDDRNNLITYLTKYVSKDGELIIYLAPYKYFPDKKFTWWNEEKEKEVINCSFGRLF